MRISLFPSRGQLLSIVAVFELGPGSVVPFSQKA
uniref:Uncharacterized protein n=1 Tax=Arundo donax TaxID=35708 RepID=A0A0A9AEQ7_ARUDO